MNLHRTKISLFVFIFLLSACAKQAQPIPPTADLLPSAETSVPPTATLPPPTETSAPPTEVPTETATEVPSNTDPALFGTIEKSKLDPLASNIQDVIFRKTMDGFIANRNIIEYRITASEAFPSSDGTIIVQVFYNVRTTDPSWLVDGGTQADGNWITDKCNRFDFVNTENEFQLKNRRTCN